MSTSDATGARKGDYIILGVLGAGGMGKVYKVRNSLSDRVEAMKVLLPDLSDQKDLADRFLREIKVLASLHHPNIAELRTALTIDNQLVMIMEYVEGVTLSQRLQQPPLTYADSIAYIDQVLSALSYAHSKGVVHRDIKPANMIVTSEQITKLMDFGIARSTSNDMGLTMTGTTLGSVAYMSPEQVRCETIDARSDLYSVGVSLYEMVTGQRPYVSRQQFRSDAGAPANSTHRTERREARHSRASEPADHDGHGERSRAAFSNRRRVPRRACIRRAAGRAAHSRNSRRASLADDHRRIHSRAARARHSAFHHRSSRHGASAHRRPRIANSFRRAIALSHRASSCRGSCAPAPPTPAAYTPAPTAAAPTPSPPARFRRSKRKIPVWLSVRLSSLLFCSAWDSEPRSCAAAPPHLPHRPSQTKRPKFPRSLKRKKRPTKKTATTTSPKIPPPRPS